jgi:hypothetical protein
MTHWLSKPHGQECNEKQALKLLANQELAEFFHVKNNNIFQQ